MNSKDVAAKSRGETVSVERLGEVLAMVQQRCPELAVVAIPWMHLRHPLHPVQQALLRGEGWSDVRRGGVGFRVVGETILVLYRLAESVIYAMYCWGRLLWLRLRMRRGLEAVTRQSFDLIIKTWLRDVEWAKRDEDFYFGDLQQRLAQRHIQVLLLCGSVAGEGWTPFARACANASWPRLSELCLVPPSAPLRMLVGQWRAFYRLRRLAARIEDSLVKYLSDLASLDCLLPTTARAGLYYWIGHTAVRTWHPRAMMTVYEAQGWEQVLRWGVKTADASCQVIGYQHVPLFPEATSLLSPPRSPGLPVHPDIILCLGKIPRELLRLGHEPYGTRLVPFGSFRYRASSVNRPAPPSRRTVLVVPEGYPSAVHELFHFACACADRLPSYTFLLRCHPGFPRTQAIRKVLAQLLHRPNIVLSGHHGIKDDLIRSSVVLYRGSSAVVESILHGLLPVYVESPDSYDQDPLNGLPAWHARCETPEQLARTLAHHETTPPEQLQADWESATRYLNDYTGSVTDECVEALIDAARLRNSLMAPVMEATHA